jgi:hypothetical protein
MQLATTTGATSVNHEPLEVKGMQLDEALTMHYRLRGYCLPPGPIFDDKSFQRLSAICYEHISRRGDVAGDDLDKPHFSDERFLEFLLASPVLDLVEPICGPDVVLGSSHLVAKDPHTRATPWHEDSAYLARGNTLTDYTRMVSVWLSINGSTVHNGCMRVIPGTHVVPDAPDYRQVQGDVPVSFSYEIPDVDESAAVSFVLAPGEASLHDGRIMHASFPNRSDDFRIGFVMRYFPATVGVQESRMDRHKLWLARGKSHGVNRYENE